MIEWAWVVAVGVAAAWYFHLGIGLSLEWTDEGQIVYPSWRVAQGALPYRDFMQLYGPSVFFLNGVLLRLFGADLSVIRVLLIVVKAAVAALAYAAARMVAPRPFALAAAALLIASWGAPIWVFNAPYPNHYAMALILAGLVTFVAGQQRLLVACLVAGLCFGVASTFKQTAGLFAYIALGLVLLRRGGASRAAQTGDGLVRLAWLVFLAAGAGLVGVYLAPANTSANALVLAAPLGVVAAVLAVDMLRGRGAASERRDGLIGLAIASAGFVLPLGACAAFFAARGALRELLFNTAAGLPQVVRWFAPVAAPSALLLMLTAGTLAGGWGLATGRPRYTVAAAIALGVSGMLVAVEVAIGDPTGQTLRQLMTILLLLVVWWGVAVAFADRLPARVGAAMGAAPSRADALPVFAFAAAASVLLLYPSGDLPHVLMAWPLCVPLLAHLLWRWYGTAASTAGLSRRLALGALLAGLLAAVGAPFVGMLAGSLAQPAPTAHFARASGVVVPDRPSADAARVIRYLAQRPDGPLLVLCNEQMLYFLAGRDSVVASREFVLYLVGTGAIADADAHRILDDPAFVSQLETHRPLVVDRPGEMTARLRRVYPAVAGTLDAHYRSVYAVGAYQVLEWQE
jgi:hypothetical protein